MLLRKADSSQYNGNKDWVAGEKIEKECCGK